MGRKNTKNPGEKSRFRIVYAVIALIFLYVIVQSFFLAQNGRAGYVVAQIGDLQEIQEFTGVITREEQLIRAPQGLSLIHIWDFTPWNPLIKKTRPR